MRIKQEKEEYRRVSAGVVPSICQLMSAGR